MRVDRWFPQSARTTPHQEGQLPLVSRRDILKKSAVGAGSLGAAVLMGRGLVDFIPDSRSHSTPQIPLTSANSSQPGRETPVTIPTPEETIPSVRTTVPEKKVQVRSTPTPEPDFLVSQPDYVKAVQKQWGVLLLTLEEAARSKAKLYDTSLYVYEKSITWDPDRTAMIDEFMPIFPEPFRLPDKDGDKLIFILTNFKDSQTLGNELNGVFCLNMELGFNPKNKSEALEDLAHEWGHDRQDRGYSRLNQLLPKVFGMSIEQFCKRTIAVSDTHKVPILPGDDAFYGRLFYGVQDTKTQAPRTNTNEFEAIMAELYLHGPNHFIPYMAEVYGDKAEWLYKYMRDYIFLGKEYDYFPLDHPQYSGEKDLRQGVEVFNSVIENLVKPQGRGLLAIPDLDIDSVELRDAYRRGDLLAQTGQSTEDGRWASMKYIDNKSTPDTISAFRNVGPDGTITKENIVVIKPEVISTLRYLAADIFNFPNIDAPFYEHHTPTFNIVTTYSAGYSYSLAVDVTENRIVFGRQLT